MINNSKIETQRRTAIKKILLGTTGLSMADIFALNSNKIENNKTKLLMKGNINHSVCKWCYGDIPLDEFAIKIKEIGITGIDLIGPKDWHILKKHNLNSTMCNGAEISLTEGFNHLQYHPKLIDSYKKHIDLVADAGYTNLICFSGNRRGLDDEAGLENCVKGIKEIIGLAEKRGVVLQMELFNSKVDHPDYMCDNSKWGVELCKRLGSDNFKLLYDIYHMQISEGDIIRTIKENHLYFGHYHTAGVPGRNEIDETQELFYPPIMKTIFKTGFKGFVAQEFIPKYKDAINSLKDAVILCDI
jgi:hydroxypyruvate isomerase